MTSVLVKELYPFIARSLDKNSSKFRSNIEKFINDRHSVLFDIAPYDRIYYNQSDIDALYQSLDITEEQVINIMKKCFFWNKPYNPQCAKEPYVEVVMMAIRYYLKNNDRKNAELASVYLAFSGKFYASIHAGIVFPAVAPGKYRTIMDYVVNNMLTDKFDLKKYGTVFNAVREMCKTWLNKYGSEIKGNATDDRIGKIIQQLRDREKAFLKNIGKLFYEAYENRNYLNYETDNLDDEAFRLADNDAASAARFTENTMNYLTSHYVSLDVCNMCKDTNVKATEVKDIIEAILADNKNLPAVRRVINIIICDYLRNYPGGRINSIEFISYSIKPKPNTKDPVLIEMKNTIVGWLDENSPNYRRRRTRIATANSYYKSILTYFVLTINKISKR